jgi:hypothetical protein
MDRSSLACRSQGSLDYLSWTALLRTGWSQKHAVVVPRKVNRFGFSKSLLRHLPIEAHEQWRGRRARRKAIIIFIGRNEAEN